jgi:hypothetical protein
VTDIKPGAPPVAITAHRRGGGLWRLTLSGIRAWPPAFLMAGKMWAFLEPGIAGYLGV